MAQETHGGNSDYTIPRFDQFTTKSIYGIAEIAKTREQAVKISKKLEAYVKEHAPKNAILTNYQMLGDNDTKGLPKEYSISIVISVECSQKGKEEGVDTSFLNDFESFLGETLREYASK